MPPGVLCCGNLVLDTVVRPVPDRVAWNESAWVEAMEAHVGGNGANTAYALAGFGVPVRLLGMVGGDESGDKLLALLDARGVDIGSVGRCDLPTASSVVLVREDGARALLHRPGASQRAFWEIEHISSEMFRGCARLHVANPFSLPGLRKNGAELLRQARGLGLETSLDTGWDARDEWMRALEKFLPFTGLLFTNLDEARQLTGFAAPERAARVLLGAGASVVALKLGARGCAVFSAAESFEAPGFPVEAVDTTGAGDCFAGGWLAASQRGNSVRAAARFANAAGALSVGALGSVSGLRSYEETLGWMRNRSGA